MTSYADLEAKAAELAAMRVAYLEERGWKLQTRITGRWWKDVPWGTASTRRVVADLLDAVNWTIRYEKEVAGEPDL